MDAPVGLDLSFLAPGATGGMEVAARALVPALREVRPQLGLVAFCGRELAAELRERPWVDGLRVVELPVSSDTRFRRTAVEQLVEPWLVRRSGVGLVHSLGNTAPLAPMGVPHVLTVMDVIWARHPETHGGVLAQGLSLLVRGGVRRATRVVVPSEATARDLVELLRVPRGRIDVVPLGPGVDPVAEPTPAGELRARLGLGDGPLVLCPAPRRPHKNVARLVEAMSGLDATLVVPGYAPSAEERLDAPGVRIVSTGWLAPADLEGLYAAATCLAFPSLAEGFGLPVLEAMRRGLPVACSDATSLPEVAGDAAITFDPLDVAAIRAAVRRLLGDPALREDLAARGRAQAAGFSWRRCAEETLAVYDRLRDARRG